MWKVVVVEDEDLLRQGLVRTIPWERYHFSVAGEADNGRDGLRLVRGTRPDVVITDIRMPIMNGLDMAEQIHAWDAAICIVFISGYDEFEYAHRAVKVAASDYILKPVNLAEVEKVLEKLDEMLTRQKKAQETYATLQRYYSEKQAEKSEVPEEAPVKSPEISGGETEKAIRTYIEEHYAECDLKLHTMAKHLYMSPSYLTIQIKRFTGKTFVEYLTDVRMDHARALLEETDLKAYEISERCGFANATYFSTVFKNIYRISPKRYQMKYRR